MTEMTGRPHAVRLREDLLDIRRDLAQTVRAFTADALDWAPKAGMKTVRQIVQEIGAMESVTLHVAAQLGGQDWTEAFESVSGADADALLASLDSSRAETLAYLERCSEAQLETPIRLPDAWHGYFNATEIEPEELLRWIARHEYYHLGQLITYQMQRS